MIKYPIANRDLLRNIMAKCDAANVVFHDPEIQNFAADSTKGLCSFRIVTDAEEKRMETVYDLDGNSREYETTVQHHHVEVEYYDPEAEFEILLRLDNTLLLK